VVVKEVVRNCPELLHAAQKFRKFLATMCQVGYLVLYSLIVLAKTTNRL